jgi:hypothetical protein
MERISRRKFFKTSALSALSLIYLPKFIRFKNTIFFEENEEIFKSKIKSFIDAGLGSKPLGGAIVEVGKSFLGTEYVANTLEINPNDEQLVVNLGAFDCVTFVENCMALARCMRTGKTSYDDFKELLMKIRYRHGIIDGYTSRLHYFCDWIYDNQLKSYVNDITRDLGGEEYAKNINFMSTHVNSYKQLADSSNLEKIKAVEDEINLRTYFYIPKKNINKISDRLQNGDIIATTTSIQGLDVTHTGYVIKDESGGTYFLHASSIMKEVIISSNSLADYIKEDPKKTGIMVARPLDFG